VVDKSNPHVMHKVISNPLIDERNPNMVTMELTLVRQKDHRAEMK
jgi:hypothetical protein